MSNVCPLNGFICLWSSQLCALDVDLRNPVEIYSNSIQILNLIGLHRDCSLLL